MAVVTDRVAAGSERNVGHVVTGDNVAAFQRADAQTSAADRQSNVASSMFHVRSVAQDPLDSPIDLSTK